MFDFLFNCGPSCFIYRGPLLSSGAAIECAKFVFAPVA